jgi:hypothetical protein
MFEEARPWQRHRSHRPLFAVGRGSAIPSDLCLMELAARLGGEPGTDHPECVHPTLGAVARGVYEQCSDETKTALLPLAPSLLDTVCTGLDVSARLVATCASTALASPHPERIDADRSQRLDAARRTALYLMSRGGDEGPGADPDEEPRSATRMWVHLLDPFRLTEPVYRRLVSPEAVAEAVVVTARASGDARDERLSQLLRWCIDLTRRLAIDRRPGMRGKSGSGED